MDLTGRQLGSSAGPLAARALLTLATSQGGLDRREPIDMSALTERALLAQSVEVDRLGVHVEAATGPSVLDGDYLLIERMVANLVDNAVRHNVGGGRLAVTTGTEQGRAVPTVANTGPVIAAVEVDRLFQPLQRLDERRLNHPHGHGLGLGLSIVRAIASAHGATVTANAPSSGGLTITVTFLRQPEHGTYRASSGRSPAAGCSYTITPARPAPGSAFGALHPQRSASTSTCGRSRRNGRSHLLPRPPPPTHSAGAVLQGAHWQARTTHGRARLVAQLGLRKFWCNTACTRPDKKAIQTKEQHLYC